MPTTATREIPLSAVDVSKFNTRKDLGAGVEDVSLEDLASSIRERGLINPPTVRETAAGRFEVIAGQRRVMACLQLGWEFLPAIIRNDLTDEQAVALSLVENVQRADMSPLDKARAFQALRDQTRGDLKMVCKMTGVGEATVRRYLALLQLPADLQNRVTTGNGAAGIGLMSQLASSFTDADAMRKAWEQVGGFSSGVAQTILRRSGGDVNQLPSLVDLAIEGEFDRKTCGSSLETCPFLPERLRSAVRELIARAEAGEF